MSHVHSARTIEYRDLEDSVQDGHGTINTDAAGTTVTESLVRISVGTAARHEREFLFGLLEAYPGSYVRFAILTLFWHF